MSPQDLINGIFELGASVMILNHCRTLYIHKEVKGVSLLSTFFFLCWGFWNIYYYNHLNQPLSFYGGIMALAANACWIAMMIYYSKKSKINSDKIEIDYYNYDIITRELKNER